MSSNRHHGTSLEATSTAVQHLEDRLALPDGADTNCTIEVLDPDDTNRLYPNDTLAHFSLGPC